MAPLLANETADSLTLTNGVVIEVHTASYRTTRGYTLVAALCDEVAFWRDEGSANPDVEILNALRPGLGTLGGVLLIASSPYAKRGALYTAFKDHFGKDDPEVMVWLGSTIEMNPGFSRRVIAKAYEADTAAAAAEFGAEFRNDVAAFVDRTVVESCIELGCYERLRNSTVSRSYVAFIDASGGSGSDSMTCAIAHRENDLAVLDSVRERQPPFSPEDVVQEFSDLLKSYGVTSAESDKWGGDWVGEAFRKRGVIVTPSAKPKSDIYRELLPLLNAGQCSLFDLPRLASQLCGLERRTARGGRDSIDHSPGGHDDLANAAAGALLMAGKRSGYDSTLAWV